MVAARTRPSTSGRTTIGIWTAAATTMASRPIDTSNRQLHWPSRSSQTGTSGLRLICEVGSTPRTETTAPEIANAKATTGIAANSPTIPARAAPAGSEISASAGWMWTVLW